MSKPVILTPEQIKSGVQKNVTEYNARVEALRALHSDHAYNPPVDQTRLNEAAVEASRGAVGLPSMRVYSQDGVIGGDVKLSAADRAAEEQASKGGKRRAVKETSDESGQESPQGDGGIQAGDAAFGQQARPASPFAQAGHSDSAQSVGAGPKVQVFEAESKEALIEKIPAGAVAVTYKKLWRAYVIME